MERDGNREKKTALATFAAGCFWGKEYFLQRQPGVVKTRVGFIGGHTTHPTYKDVCQKKTGHAEAVEVTFDTEETSYTNLVRFFFNMHDPTIDRRDKGGQYRSAIFFHSSEQKETAQRLMDKLRLNNYHVVTTLEEAGTFWPASARHQKYCDARDMQPVDRYTQRI